ncbi:hypothetical protein KEM54_005113 [Ascosphaera aggregata]|nr:hypothetical protein KEM54_005113 [Ascosphaera aggregata]
MAFSLCKFSAILAAAVALSSAAPTSCPPKYKDPKQPINDRVEDLLQRMTVEDKMAQLIQGDIANWLNETTNAFNYTGLVENMRTRAGSVFTGRFVPWDVISDMTKRGQDYLLENTTVAIPAFMQSEGIHGFELINGTVFNSAIGYSSSWNRDLVEKMAHVIGREARAVGTNQLFAPVIDLTLDPRYGRIEEALGEDSYLAAELGYHYVLGVQAEKVSATVKHFIAYGSGQQGLNLAPHAGGERELRMKWLPAFKKPIMEGKAHSVMSSYNSYDGVPAISNPHTLIDILREEWGFENYVISDGGASDRPCEIFHMCSADPFDRETTTKLMLENGNDVEMGGGHYSFEVIPELVKKGELKTEDLDRAVRHILHAKFEAGLFEEPFIGVPHDQFHEYIHTKEAVDVARQLDAESIVLLENHNKTLPLKKQGKIAVIGPFAGHMNYGDYVVPNTIVRGVNPLEGIKKAVGDKAEVSYALGCEAWSNDRSKFQEAVDVAKKSDVAIVVVGTWSADQNLLWAGANVTTGEGADVNDLRLVGPQADLIKEIKKTGVRTVVVFSSGKPISEPWLSDEVDALVQHFYPGEEGGNALADVIFGAHNPSGRLTISFPHFVGDLPVYYNRLNSARQLNKIGHIYPNGTMDFGRSYVFGDANPWYEFGYGLSYSNFEYSNVTLSKKNITVGEDEFVNATVKVTNKGPYDGQEVVQVYVKDLIATVDIPVKELRGFEKVFIKNGETKEVTIPIKVIDLALWGMKNEYVVEAGDFEVQVGRSSDDIKTTAIFNVGESKVVKK